MWNKVGCGFRTGCLKNLKYIQQKIANFLWFQYRILHIILCTKKLLFMLKIKASPLCPLCHSTAETIFHPFLSLPSGQKHLVMCWRLGSTKYGEFCKFWRFNCSIVFARGKQYWIRLFYRLNITYQCFRQNMPVQLNDIK